MDDASEMFGDAKALLRSMARINPELNRRLLVEEAALMAGVLQDDAKERGVALDVTVTSLMFVLAAVYSRLPASGRRFAIEHMETTANLLALAREFVGDVSRDAR